MSRHTARTTGGSATLSQDAPRSWTASITTRADGRRSVIGFHGDSQAAGLRFIERHAPDAARLIARAFTPY